MGTPTEAGTGTWDDRLELAPRLVPTGGGRPVPTRAPLDSWGLSRWLDDETVLGGGPGADGTVLITCTVPTGACDVVPGTEDVVRLPL